MALQKTSFQWLPSADGTLRGTHPRGTFVPPATLSWGSLVSVSNAISSKFTGTPYSADVRGFLQGTDAAIATITIVQVSGDNAVTEGWSIVGGDDLEHPGDNTGSGTFRLRATSGALVADSEVLNWSWITSSVDTLAPTTPTGFKVTPYEGGVTVEHDASCDPYSGATQPSLVKEYTLSRGGSPVLTTAASPGLSNVFTSYNIGSISNPGAPSAMQSGHTWTLQAAGTGIHGTASDQCLFLGTPVSGNFNVIAKINAYTSPQQFSTAGIMIRQSEASNEPYFACYIQPSSPGHGIQVKQRVSQGSTSGNIASVGAITTAWVKITRTGNSFTAYYSTDAKDWVLIATNSNLPMNSSVKAGLFLTSQSAGNQITSTIEQLNINNVPALSYNFDTATGGSWSVVARDNDLNTSPSSSIIIVDPLPDAPSNLIRWHPGHYVMIDGILRSDNRTSMVPNMLSQIDQVANHSSAQYIKGIKIFMQWGFLEGATPGSYSQGLAETRQLADRCRQYGFRLALSFLHVHFNATLPNVSAYFPAYIINESQYGITQMTNGVISRIWQQPTMDRVIAQGLAYANADNGHGVAFKDDPTMEWYQIDETAIGVTNGVDGFSTTATSAQYKRWMDAMRTAAPNMGLRLTANFMGAHDTMSDIIEYAVSKYCMVGGPDIIPNQGVQANKIFSGTTVAQDSSLSTLTRPIVDYRGVGSFISEVQSASMNGTKGDHSAAQIYNWAINGGVNGSVTTRGMNPSHVVWYKKEWEQGSSGPTDSGGIKYSSARRGDSSPSIRDFIASISGAVGTTSCPSNWPGCDTSS